MASFAKQASEEEEDEFWSSSRVKKSKFNMFDDSVSVETADTLARTKKILEMGNEDDTDLECINWDGTPVNETSVKTSLQHENLSSNPSVSSLPPSTRPDPSIQPRPSSYMTHSRSQSHTYGISIGQGTTSVSYSKSQERLAAPRSTSSDNLSLDEVVSSSMPRQEIKQDPIKMAEQIRFLQRSLEKVKISGISKPSVEETIKRIIHGEPFSLEVYKGKEEKLALLDKAISLHDGSPITTIILFLRRTVKPGIFNIELQRRPVAVNHYISYLKAHYDFRELADFLGMLGRIEEAAMLKYKQAAFILDAGAKIRNLDSCRKAHFMAEPQLQQESSLIQEQISLLERQRPIEETDNAAEKEGKIPLFKSFPRKASIINKPVITTLYYCCFYHPHLAENSFASPAAIRKQHQLTDKQFVWTALSARSRLKQWTGVEELLTTKGWFGGTKMRAVIGFDRVCEVLHSTSAPLDILSKYLRLVENTDKRLSLSKKMKCHDIVVDILEDFGAYFIEFDQQWITLPTLKFLVQPLKRVKLHDYSLTLVTMKDKAALEEYASKLTPYTRESQYARDALNGSVGKFK